LLIPGFSIIAEVFHLVDLTKITLLNESVIMALGISSCLCSCLAVVYGKWIIYLITSVILIASCCWGAAAKSYYSLLAARIVQGDSSAMIFTGMFPSDAMPGLGMGGFFALAGKASINDVFFLHERRVRAGLWSLAVIVCIMQRMICIGCSNLSILL
jgi:hypothetical protein